VHGFQLDIPPRDAADLDMQLNSVYPPGLYIARLKYGAAAKIRTSQNYDDYRFMTPLRGRLCGSIANDDVSCRPEPAWIPAPVHPAVRTISV